MPAASDEDYVLAQKLKVEAAEVQQLLPPTQRFLVAKVKQLKEGATVLEKVRAA